MGLLLGAAPAFAGAITYADFGAWSGAVSGVTTVTIPDPSPEGFVNYGTGDASVTFSGVVFSASSTLGNGVLFDVGPLFSGSAAVLSDQSASIGIENILITFPEAVMGFAFDYGTFGGSDVTFALSNGDTVVQGSSTDSGYLVPDFVGVTDSPFTWVLVTSGDSVLNLNNVSYASDASVPEPASWLLLATAGFGLLAYGRRTLGR
jgi:hypothetical protein